MTLAAQSRARPVLIRFISCGPEVVGAFCGRELVDEFPDGVPQAGDRSLGGLAQESLQLDEGVFDGIEIGE